MVKFQKEEEGDGCNVVLTIRWIGLYRYFMRFRNQKGLMQWQQKNGHNGQFVPGDEG
jgi:hypothetical protein